MEYKVGELAKMLDMSPSMVRYYEKCGVIKPVRGENNYRMYSTMDLFALSEAVALSRFDVNIKDIYELKEDEFTSRIVKAYRQYAAASDQKIQMIQLMKRRAEQLADRIETAPMNVNNCWLKKTPAYISFKMLQAKDDSYGDIIALKEVQKSLSEISTTPFVDGFLMIEEGQEEWHYALEDIYASHLHLPVEDGIIIPSEYCLCTIVDMGPVGTFHADDIRIKAAELQQKEYEFTGEIRCLLLGRGYAEGMQHRYLELQLPCKP